jgi:hypothetical protein
MKTQKETIPAPVLDPATIAAVQAQLKRAERDDAIKAHGFALEPYKCRYTGSAVRRLVDEIQRLRTDLSESEPAPPPSAGEVLVTGAIVGVGRGDRKPDPVYFEHLPDDEAAEAHTMQDALRFRAAEAPLLRERGVLASAEREVAGKTEAVAEANKARDFAAGVRDFAVARVDREEKRFAEFLGGRDEAALRAVLSTLKPPAPPKSEGDFLIVSRGGGVVERIPVSA